MVIIVPLNHIKNEGQVYFTLSRRGTFNSMGFLTNDTVASDPYERNSFTGAD